ncbi:MAG: hypothetical protein ACE5I7_09770 [Candidatus Binatia bacterium]
MTQAQPFSPDDVYCVYCHAPAAGVCAACAASCCGDCVELVMGLTVRRAVCRSCMLRGHRPAGAGALRWLIAGAGAVLAASLLLLAYLSR